MARLLCMLCIAFAPLGFAQDDANFTWLAPSVTIKLVKSDAGLSADVSCTMTVRNDGTESAFEFRLPSDLLPAKTDKETRERSFTIEVDTQPVESEFDRDQQFQWTINVPAGEQVTLNWSYTSSPTFLPQLHPQGRRRLIVPLAHLRTLATPPATVPIAISFKGLEPSLLDQPDTAPLKIEHPGGTHMADFQFEWYAATLTERRAVAQATLDAIKEKQRARTNRSYTSALVQLAELAHLQNDHATTAETCAKLADLSEPGQAPVIECGPGTQWRRHVPWRLLQFEAAESLAQDTKQVAQKAADFMNPVWEGYLKARATQRPFDHFDRGRFGSYWDYDWKRTQDLYARALDTLGENDAATAVREVEA